MSFCFLKTSGQHRIFSVYKRYMGKDFLTHKAERVSNANNSLIRSTRIKGVYFKFSRGGCPHFPLIASSTSTYGRFASVVLPLTFQNKLKSYVKSHVTRLLLFADHPLIYTLTVSPSIS